MTDAEWAELQQREANLRSFQVQPKRRRVRRPSPIFEPWQVAVAVRVLDAEVAS